MYLALSLIELQRTSYNFNSHIPRIMLVWYICQHRSTSCWDFSTLWYFTCIIFCDRSLLCHRWIAKCGFQCMYSCWPGAIRRLCVCVVVVVVVVVGYYVGKYCHFIIGEATKNKFNHTLADQRNSLNIYFWFCMFDTLFCHFVNYITSQCLSNRPPEATNGFYTCNFCHVYKNRTSNVTHTWSRISSNRSHMWCSAVSLSDCPPVDCPPSNKEAKTSLIQNDFPDVWVLPKSIWYAFSLIISLKGI